MLPPIHIVGNFPPPINGQTMATHHLAGLLSPSHDVHRTDTSLGADAHVQAEVRFSLGKVQHYLRLRRRIRRALQAAPTAPVLWSSISPSPLGHLRDVLAVLPGFQPGQRVYAIIHWGNFDRVFRHPATAPTALRMARRLQGFVFNSDQLAERCAAWIPATHRFIIPNTIDDALYCTDESIAAKQEERKNRDGLRLLFLSNMIASKGYLDVLHAVRLLHARGLPLHADFAGRWTSDADRLAFEQIVETECLGSVVTHHGGLSDRARIKALYLQADVFLLPSYYPTEAQPHAIIEALNAGTPVVTTRHAGIPDIVRPQEALFVPPRSPEAIADAVERLAEYNTWRTYSRHARQRFEDHFGPEAVRARWLALLTPPASE